MSVKNWRRMKQRRGKLHWQWTSLSSSFSATTKFYYFQRRSTDGFKQSVWYLNCMYSRTSVGRYCIYLSTGQQGTCRAVQLSNSPWGDESTWQKIWHWKWFLDSPIWFIRTVMKKWPQRESHRSKPKRRNNIKHKLKTAFSRLHQQYSRPKSM